MHRLTNRDLNVLKTLNKLRVLDIVTIYQLCGFTRYNKCADRLSILVKEGYVISKTYNGSVKKYFTLTQKGMNILYPREERITKNDKKYIYQKKPPVIKVSTINHELMVAKVLLQLLKSNHELTIDDFKSDREMMMSLDYNSRVKEQHQCDLYCEKYKAKIEVELSVKKKNELIKNFYLNGNNYVQVWIVNGNLLYNRLSNLLDINGKFVGEIVKIDDIDKKNINLFELHEKLYKTNGERHEEMEHLNELREKRSKQMSMFD